MAARFWVGGAGTWDNTSTANWAATTGGAAGASAPTSVDTATFDANSGTGTVSVAATAVSSSTTHGAANINLSLSGSPTLCTSTGTFNLNAGTLSLGTNSLTVGIFNAVGGVARTIDFGASGQINVTANNTTVFNLLNATTAVTLIGTSKVNCTYSGATGTRTLRNGNSAATAANIYITAGTDTVTATNGYSFGTVDFTGFSGTYTPAQMNIYGNLVISTGMTVGSSTQASVFLSTSGTKQITTNGKTLDFPLTFNGVGGTFAFQDALTQGSTRAFTITNGTVQLKNGVTSTVGAFVTSGTNQKFLQSTIAGSQATLSQASGTVNASYLTIQDISAIGGATWNSLWSNNNVDAGDNTGWLFGDPPVVLAAEYTYALRSFTQPRRF